MTKLDTHQTKQLLDWFSQVKEYSYNNDVLWNAYENNKLNSYLVRSEGYDGQPNTFIRHRSKNYRWVPTEQCFKINDDWVCYTFRK